MFSSPLLHQTPPETAFVTNGDALGVDEIEKNLLTRKRKAGQTGLSGDTSSSPEALLDSGQRKCGGRKGASKENNELHAVKLYETDDPVGSHTKSQAAVDMKNLKPIMRAPISKAREMRLEQNRKAACESRRRKKVMIEELQRSVVFFSRANGTLKQQNDELQRMLVQAQAQAKAMEQTGAATQGHTSDGTTAMAPGYTAAPTPADCSEPATSRQAVASQQAQDQAQASHVTATQFQFQNVTQVQAAASQAIYESQGFSPAAARVAAQTLFSGQHSALPAPVEGSAPVVAAPGTDGPADVAAPTPPQQNPQVVASALASPFMAAVMGMGVHPTTGAPGAAAPTSRASAPAPGIPATTPTANPMDAFNQFSMQQQFAAQLGAIGVAGVPAGANQFFQQQVAAMQLAAAGHHSQHQPQMCGLGPQ